MTQSKNALHRLMSAILGSSPPPRRRPTRQLTPMLNGLEERIALSHVGVLHHHHHVQHVASTSAAESSTASTTSTTSSTSATSLVASTSTSSSALGTARQQLFSDIQTIELASGTTIGELTAIRAAFQTLSSDGLTPSSQSALSSFEDSLVKAYANGTTLTGNATLLAQFEALYTSSPTTQETTDLTTAYNAIAAAIASSNITAADLTTIDADQAAVQAASGDTSGDTFPYFTLVTGAAGGMRAYGGGMPGGMAGGCN
jgi:hypothetical protein